MAKALAAVLALNAFLRSIGWSSVSEEEIRQGFEFLGTADMTVGTAVSSVGALGAWAINVLMRQTGSKTLTILGFEVPFAGAPGNAQ